MNYYSGLYKNWLVFTIAKPTLDDKINDMRLSGFPSHARKCNGGFPAMAFDSGDK